jgi:hypothetical protein
MAYVTPPTFVPSDPLAADDLNTLGDDIGYLKAITDGVGFSGVQLRRTSTQSILDTTWTAITWQTESGGFDYGSWWSSGTNIVVPAGAIPSGFTTIACQVLTSTNFSSNGTGTRFIRILVNGSETEKRSVTAISGDVTYIPAQDFIVVAAGDVITVEVYQSSGSTLTISGSNSKVTVTRYAPVA